MGILLNEYSAGCGGYLMEVMDAEVDRWRGGPGRHRRLCVECLGRLPAGHHVPMLPELRRQAIVRLSVAQTWLLTGVSVCLSAATLAILYYVTTSRLAEAGRCLC